MRRLFIIIPLVVIAFYSALYAYGLVQLRRAQQVVGAVAQLRVGSVQPNRPFGTSRVALHCTPDRRCYVGVSNLPFVELWDKRGIHVPRLSPWGWWHVVAQLGFDSAGKVTDKELGIDNGQYHQFGMLGISMREDAALDDPCHHPAIALHPGYFPHREIRTGALLIDLSPTAAQPFIGRAFDIHLDCLNTVRGCTTPEDVAPSAWNDIYLTKDVNFDSGKCKITIK
jgi:hypothetical protein